jgi:hypothetical protein
MKIVSFINPGQRDVIDKILTHDDLSSRAPLSEARRQDGSARNPGCTDGQEVPARVNG